MKAVKYRGRLWGRSYRREWDGGTICCQFAEVTAAGNAAEERNAAAAGRQRGVPLAEAVWQRNVLKEVALRCFNVRKKSCLRNSMLLESRGSM